jgi:hypothetical protein
MAKQDPILIAAPPRSGTTVLAAVLNAHGVWVGRSRTTRYPGTNMNFGAENIDIKNIMKREARGYSNWDIPLPDPRLKEETKAEVEELVPDNTPWLVKTSWTLTFWKGWKDWYPNARWLFPVRDIEKIVDSMNRHPGMAKHKDEEKYHFVQALQRRRFEVITTDVKYICFGIEKFVDKNKDVVDELFNFLGILPDWDKINEIIDPTMLKR